MDSKEKSIGREKSPRAEERFAYERQLLTVGDNYPIAGVDEAGRGPLAGPVAAAAVVFPREWIMEGMPDSLCELNDSKQLSHSKREYFYEELQSRSEVIKAVVMIEAAEIDRLNILRATHLAMVRALEAIALQGVMLRYVLVDGLDVKAISLPHTPLVRGDSKSYSIAAASILAKVERDRLMMEYDQHWPEYGFALHKGYGTKSHLRALKEKGLCPIHRRTFIHLYEQGTLELF